MIEAPEILYEKDSVDGTRKWVLSVGDGDLFEMVLIPEGRRATFCVSSQVGCAVDCSFCATGKQGFSRNLSTSEIIGQLWVAENSFGYPREHSDKKVTNIVMMGMGEPLLNFEAVTSAMKLMMHDKAYGLSKRKVTLSTSGLVPLIDKLSEVTYAALTISLHAGNKKLRNELVPINKKYPIDELLESVKRYVSKCGDKRKTTIEYILINQVNDSLENAEELSNLLRTLPCKINLIPFNPFPGSSYKRPSSMRVQTFKKKRAERRVYNDYKNNQRRGHNGCLRPIKGKVNDRTRRKER
jgi:23S rRNA m2A2503 methyltransferase